MGKVWVRAKSIVHAEENGKVRSYHPGDWLQIGRQQARECLARNEIEILKSVVLRSVQDLSGCAIVTTEAMAEPDLSFFAGTFPGVPIEQYLGDYPEHNRFLLWDMAAKLKRDLILTGFDLLYNWQLAVPLLDYSVLAESAGTDEERQETKAVIHDLRVPIYDCRVIFARQCKETRKLFELWDGSQLGFLQALYQTIPAVLALPPSWVLE